MGVIYFKNKQKEVIDFEPIYVDFIRGENNNTNRTVNFSNGLGQVIITNQILYSSGSVGQPNYLEVKSDSNYILSGSGSFNVDVIGFPNSTQQSQTININVHGNTLPINFTYNSRPQVELIELTIPNQSTRILKLDDFISKFSDFDGDQMAGVFLIGDVTGYKINGVDYISEQEITIQNLFDELFTYESLNQNPAYTKTNSWKAKDSLGNISLLNENNFVINVEKGDEVEDVCKQPIITSATYSNMQNFHIEWNYNGGIYQSAQVTIKYTINGVDYTDYPIVYNYPDTEAFLNIPSLPAWEILTFKIFLVGGECIQESTRYSVELIPD